jgi:transcriptional regulator with XRE-family HTH domain
VAEQSERGRGEADAPSDRHSIGRYLAAQRQLRGISLDDLSARTKIPRRNLERLESGVFDGQLDGFVRGFVRTVAEALGLDPQEAVMRIVAEPDGDDDERLWRRRVRAGVIGAVLAVLLLIALGIGLRMVTRWIVEPAGGPPDHVYRRDVVRSLADHERDEAGAAGSRKDGRRSAESGR